MTKPSGIWNKTFEVNGVLYVSTNPIRVAQDKHDQRLLEIEVPQPVLRRLLKAELEKLMGTEVRPHAVRRFAAGPLGTKVKLAYHAHEVKKAWKLALLSIGGGI